MGIGSESSHLAVLANSSILNSAASTSEPEGALAARGRRGRHRPDKRFPAPIALHQ
jgi:hypothetical protein